MTTHHASGAYDVTVVDGSSYTGLLDADGAINVIERTTEFGATHPCGAQLITIVDGSTAVPSRAGDGSLHVIERTSEFGVTHPSGATLVVGTV